MGADNEALCFRLDLFPSRSPAVRSFLTPARALESNSRKKLANYRLANANAETDIDNEIHYRRVSCF
jgi:hypothetical protein